MCPAPSTAIAHGSEQSCRQWLRPAVVWLALLAIVLALAPPAQAAPMVQIAGAFRPADCPLQTGELLVDCGYLTVAESRRTATSRTIELAIAILRSPNPSPAPDAALFLSGGPGQPALPLIPFIAQSYAPVLAQRDIVFIDQRGTGYSRPALNCAMTSAVMGEGMLPVIAAPQSERPQALQAGVDLLMACGQRLRAAGVDLRGYNSVENAADLEDLRRALGVPQWNLIGGSYGTRLALTAMQYRPQTIRSAVLDSVYPPQRNFHVDVFSTFDQALGRLFAECAAEAACAAAYPNLAQMFDDMVARLNANPPAIPIVDSNTGQVLTYVPLTGNDMALTVFQLLYATPVIPLLPALIAQTARGDYTAISQLVSLLAESQQQGGVPATSLGMQVAVQCNEDVTFAEPEDFVAARDRHRRAASLAFGALFNEAVLEVCAAWGLATPEPGSSATVRSDVPALMIGGALDPVTPIENASMVAEDLPNSSIVVVPRGGHTPSATSACLGGVIAAFIANPGQRPDSGCLAREAPLPFVVR
jgi:pimeloyl-ACP methyl ester carboxylesterase